MTDLTTGKRIAQCRKALALSQEALGEKLGVSRQSISKWEADAALPEIDKLITLSKLFGVSVGWLLGAEELSESQPESPPISEELLHKLEEVVKRYQPQKKRLPLWAMLCLAAALGVVLWCCIGFFTELRETQNRLDTLSSQVSRTDGEYSSISSQLNVLEDRIDSLSKAPTKFSISDYSFHIEPDSETASALVTLSAIPGSWNEAYSASVSVRRDGQQVVSQAVTWDGTGFTTRLQLPLENGYEYWFTAEYPDGTREQVELANYLAQNLEASFTIQCHITHGEGRFSLQKGTLELVGFDIHLAQPSFNSGHNVDWAGAELILYHTRGHDRRIVDTEVLFDPEKDQDAGEVIEFWSFPKGPFQLPELADGDGLELWVSAEMSNGVSLMQLVTSWAYLDGEFISGTPVE